MSDPAGVNSTIVVQGLLDLLGRGDAEASQKLLEVSMGRLRHLARKILADIPGVSRWEDTDDLLQNSAIRLWKAIERHHPETSIDYFRLAASVMRRELIDLSRHYFGPMGLGANHARSGIDCDGRPLAQAEQASDDTFNPERLTRWTEFHVYIDNLPEEEKLMFDLLWYQGLTLDQSSAISGIPERTLRRHWKTARVQLYQKLLAEGGS